jgi:hypothetical protein
MTLTLSLIASLCQLGQPLPPFQLDYVRPAGDKYVLESRISHAKIDKGYAYQSTTYRPKEKMTLRLQWTLDQKIELAELELETAQAKKTARATFQDRTATIHRPGQAVEKIELAAAPVLATTAPDWSDILIVLRRYDAKKGGKQDFAGLWFHPVKPALGLTFTVEKLGEDEITLADGKRKLGRYRVKLRSGAYVVWADSTGLVYKLMPPGQPQSAVVLKGHEKAVAALTGTTK